MSLVYETSSEELASSRSCGRPLGAVDRLPRRARAPLVQLGRFEPTSRDVAILEALYQHRALTTDQIATLLFAPTKGNTNVCRLRLQKLFHHGYVFRSEQLQYPSEPRKPYIYFVDRAGVRQLSEFYGVPMEAMDWDREDKTFKPLFLEHLLLINDTRIAVSKSAQANGFSLHTSLDERALKRTHKKDPITITQPTGGTQTTRLIPDWFMALQTGKGYFLRFWEIDRSTETLRPSYESIRSWSGKVSRYLAYYFQGYFKKRYNAESMGVLTVTTSEARLANLKRVTEEQEGKDEFWFTTFERLQTPHTDILTSPIWERASKEARFSLTDL